MIHSHNEADHQRLENTSDQLEGISDALWAEFGNGHSSANPKLARQLALLKKYVDRLKSELKSHTEDTVSYDSEVKNWRLVKKYFWWALGVAGACLVYYINNNFIK